MPNHQNFDVAVSWHIKISAEAQANVSGHEFALLASTPKFHGDSNSARRKCMECQFRRPHEKANPGANSFCKQCSLFRHAPEAFIICKDCQEFHRNRF